MSSTIHHATLSNGLHLLAEPMSGVASAAVTLLTPAGIEHEPDGQQGAAAVLSEMAGRGAGGRSAREHSEALDLLGVQRDTHAGTHHLRLAASLLGDKLDEALPLLLDMLLAPNLDEAQFEPSRDLCIQSIDALADEPQQRVMLKLRERHYPGRMGRSPLGKRADLEALTAEQLRDFWRGACVPKGSILALAGRVDWEPLRERVEAFTADWSGEIEPAPDDATAPRGYEHETAESTQTHIALAYDAVAETDARAVLQKAAMAVLDGGMSGRLFTEVRERRGLVYAVHAGYAGHKKHAAITGYAGTTTPRAQETLDVMLAEHRKLAEGFSDDEFDRALIGMKSRLVMQGESTSARAAAIAHDQYVFGRPRTLDERRAEVDAVTAEALRTFVREVVPGEVTVVTVGEQPLNT